MRGTLFAGSMRAGDGWPFLLTRGAVCVFATHAARAREGFAEEGVSAYDDGVHVQQARYT